MKSSKVSSYVLNSMHLKEYKLIQGTYLWTHVVMEGRCQGCTPFALNGPMQFFHMSQLLHLMLHFL
jgi:hypothetical protein